MKYGICSLSVVPVRAKPADASEMITQILFGDIVEIEGVHKGWLKIRIVYDAYEGWADLKQIQVISEETFKKFNEFPPLYTLDMVSIMSNITEDYAFPVLFGSSLPYTINSTFYIEDTKYEFNGEITKSSVTPNVNDIINHAYMYLYTPYLWGGKSLFGIDCSGFTQMTFKLSGIKLMRDAWQQAEQGRVVDFLTEASIGDLAFFENEEGRIVHTGILLGKDRIIHASGQVRVDNIDHQGIFNVKLNKYTHKLRLIKRFIDLADTKII